MTDAVSIPCQDFTLEGRFLPGQAGPGVVITHPHPLFGGSMDNNVVWTAERAFHSRGWATLCFNFRGVGRSGGAYGNGEAETADVAAALDFLKSRSPGPHYLAGYSFGAYVAGRALLQGLVTEGALLIAPPINFMDLSWLPQVPGLRLVVVGDLDELCPLADLRRLWSARRPPRSSSLRAPTIFSGARRMSYLRPCGIFRSRGFSSNAGHLNIGFSGVGAGFPRPASGTF